MERKEKAVTRVELKIYIKEKLHKGLTYVHPQESKKERTIHMEIPKFTSLLKLQGKHQLIYS